MLALLLFAAPYANAQSNEFTYQGNLQRGGVPANGTHDFQFALFDAAADGTQIGSTLVFNNVPVTNGTFSVKINFQNQFPGGDRFLEVRVRPTGVGTHVMLSPRTQFTSAPYSIKSANSETAVNALQLGGTPANQYVLTGDPRMTDARNPLPNSTNYVQNRTTPQITANFNISGVGNAGSFNSATTYNIAGQRMMSAGGTANTIVGLGTATGNTGSSNSFFGSAAGFDNTSGVGNSFFGVSAGSANTTGSSNAFFGRSAGTGSTGSNNSFFGAFAGDVNTTGSNNTFIGSGAGPDTSSLSFATAIGAGAKVSGDNTIILGRAGGEDRVRIPGTLNTSNVSAPRLNVTANGGNILMGDAGCSTGFLGIGFVASFTACTNHSLLGNGVDTIVNRPTGGRLFFRENNSTQMTLAPGGNFGIGTASPTERLHVNGNSLVGGNSTVGTNLTVNGSSSFVGEISAGTSATISGATTIGSTLNVGSAINTGTQYNVGGNFVLNRSRLVLVNTAAVPRGFSVEMLNSPSFLVIKNDAGSTVMTIAEDGKVGIGDNNPIEATLEIGGTLAVSNLGGSNGEHLCRNGNLIRACSVAGTNVSHDHAAGAVKIAALESIVRQQQAEIESQRAELAALKNFICSQNPGAEICGPKK